MALTSQVLPQCATSGVVECPLHASEEEMKAGDRREHMPGAQAGVWLNHVSHTH